MATAADTASPSGSPPQDKAAASRNKRKYSADQPSGELGTFELEYPMTSEEFMAAEKATLAAVAEHGDNLDNVCYTHTCTGFHTAAEGLLQSQRHVNWTDLNEVQLEEVLLKSIDVTFDNAVTMITAMGYSEAVGRAAVVRTAKQYCWRDDLSVFSEVVVDVLKTQGVPREGACVDYMRQVERAALHDLVSYIIEERPFYSVGDAMFCLLMSDMNVARACTMIYTRAPVPDVGAQVGAQPVSITNPQTGAVSRGKLIHMTPNSFNPLAVGADSSTMVAFPNLSSSKPSASGNMQCVISNMKPKEHTAAVPDRSEGQPFVAAATHSSKDGKPFTSKRGSSKRDSSHRQKFMSFDKSSRAMGSKGSLRSVKHSSLSSAALDRKSRQFTDSSTNGLKGSSKVGKGFSAVLTGSEVSLDFSFAAEAFSTLSLDTNRATSSNPVPAANTDLSVSLSSSTDVSVPSPDQNSNVEAKDPSRKINFSYHQDQNAWIPRYKKDEIVLILDQRQKEMQTHMQDWTDWAQEKVMQVTRHLSKEKEELQSLRKEKEELVRLQDERHTLEESTRKKLLEMESAISRANAQLEKANASARRRDAENAQLRMQLEAAKRHAVESATKFEALSRKDEKTLKRSQSWESERAVLQDELAAEKTKLSRVLQQLQHAKEKKDQLQARSKQEEAAKIEAIACVTSERKEREHIEILLRSEKNSQHLKAENDMQRYKSEVRALEQQIFQLGVSLGLANVAAPKWGTDNKSHALRLSEGRKSSNAPVLVQQDSSFDDIQRDRECVMCLSEEMSVVFLPCTHQVVCGKCNNLHEKQGMKDCPSCRTPIQRRVCVRSMNS